MWVVKGKNVMEAWKKAIRLTIEKGYDYIDVDGRKTREVQNLGIEITDPSQDILVPLQMMNSIGKFIYPSEDEIKEALFTHYTSSVYDYTYGERLVNFRGRFNQLEEYIIPLLNKSPESRRAIINFYDPIKDSKIKSRNIPSLIYIWFRLNNKRLNISAHIRSSDLFLGFPTNIYELYLIQQYVIKSLKLKVGSITLFANSAHVFESYKPLIEEFLKIKFKEKKGK